MTLLRILSVLMGLALVADHVLASDGSDWKSVSRNHEVSASLMLGPSVGSGFTILGTVAKSLGSGFIPDVEETPSVELQLGPVLGTGAVQFTVALRWDFHKDKNWSFYGLGGLGGAFASAFTLYPRTGLGAHYWVLHNLAIRGEYSHEMLGVGAMMTF